MSDVLVIGGGMAGALAALRARELGARVTVARRAFGATAVSSGAVDVAPDLSAPAGDLKGQRVNPLAAAAEIARSRPGHPYAVLRESLPRLGEALTFAVRMLPDLLSTPGECNLLLPTPLGTVKPTALAQRSQAGADVATLPKRVAVVSLAVSADFDARIVARGLEAAAASLGRPLEVSVVRSDYFHAVEDALRPGHEFAARLEVPGVLERFAADLQRALPPSTEAVLLPPILGRRTRDLVGRLSALLGGVRCAELLSLAPSVPGLRLQESLNAALTSVGARVIEGEVRRAPDGTLQLEGVGRAMPDAVVLATGKFIGGGVTRQRDGFREPVFGLPVFIGGEPTAAGFIGELLDQSFRGEQAAFRAGVRVDSKLRPLTLEGLPAQERLFAAGSVIRGYDPAADKTGLGVAIFTGYLAGEWAAAAPPSEALWSVESPGAALLSSKGRG